MWTEKNNLKDFVMIFSIKTANVVKIQAKN